MARLNLETMEERVTPRGWVPPTPFNFHPYLQALPNAPVIRGAVVIIDTGADPYHPLYRKNIVYNWGELPGNGKDDDGNGFVDDWAGYNSTMYYRNGVIRDGNNHGTHCAGIAVQNGATKLLIAKALDDSGSGSDEDIARAIYWGLKRGGRIFSMSFGSYEYQNNIAVAINYGHALGAIFVAASGNSQLDIRRTPAFPAAIPGVISVSALEDTLDKLAFFSNWGTVVAAPGRKILSSIPGGGYKELSGTSMACPNIAGTIALIERYRPYWNNTLVLRFMLGTADDFGDKRVRFGKVDPVEIKTILGISL